MYAEKPIKILTGNTLCICADDAPDGGTTYRMYHFFSDQPITAVSADLLLIKADSMLNKLYFPQASTQARSFTKKRMSSNIERSVKVKDNVEIPVTGDRGTFLVQVQYRQNSSWQGKVTWTDKGKSTHFRSALELLKLIDSALNESESGTEEVKFQ